MNSSVDNSSKYLFNIKAWFHCWNTDSSVIMCINL